MIKEITSDPLDHKDKALASFRVLVDWQWINTTTSSSVTLETTESRFLVIEEFTSGPLDQMDQVLVNSTIFKE